MTPEEARRARHRAAVDRARDAMAKLEATRKAADGAEQPATYEVGSLEYDQLRAAVDAVVRTGKQAL